MKRPDVCLPTCSFCATEGTEIFLFLDTEAADMYYTCPACYKADHRRPPPAPDATALSAPRRLT